MLRNPGLLAVAALFLLPALAPAQDTYTLKAKETVQGEVDLVTEEGHDDSSTSFATVGGKVINAKNSKETVAFHYKEEILKKEPGKQATRVRRTYKKAQVTTDGTTTTLPYQGKTVLIEKKGDKYHFQIEGGPELTGKEAKYLSQQFNTSHTPDSAAMKKLLLPQQAVAVGASWKLDMKTLAREMGKGGIRMDTARATGRGKLVKVYQKNGHQFGVLQFQMTLPIQSIGAGPKQSFVMAPGAKITLTATADACIDGSVSDQTFTTESQMVGEGTLKSNGLEFKLTMSSKSHKTQSSREVSAKPGASPRQDNRLKNAAFRGLEGWTKLHQSTVADRFTLEPTEGGVGWTRSNSGASGGVVGVAQNLDLDVSRATRLVVGVEVRIESHTLHSPGWPPGNPTGEYPAKITVRYLDKAGKEHTWDHGFLVDHKDYNPRAIKNFTVVPRSKWVRTTFDLLDDKVRQDAQARRALPRLMRIRRIELTGSGWDFTAAMRHPLLRVGPAEGR